MISFKEIHKNKDWVLLTDIPKGGSFEFNNQMWKYNKHGTGICFTYKNYYVDMNRNMEDNPTTFDVYRIVDYLEHLGKDKIKSEDKLIGFDYKNVSEMFNQIETLGLIKLRKDLSGKIYEIVK